MSIQLKDTQYKYILDWNETTSQLNVNEFSYGIWNAETQNYNMTLSHTYNISGGGTGGGGTSGSSGTSGTSGVSGTNGTSGSSGTAGTSGVNGVDGISTSLYKYQAKTTITTGNPTNTHMIWNNATQISSTSLSLSHTTDDNIDIDLILSLLSNGQNLYIQDKNNSGNYQKWIINGTPTQVIDTDNYWTIPVSFVSSLGTGTTNFSNNHPLFVGIFSPSGTSGTSGVNGSSGTSGSSASNDPQVVDAMLLFLAVNT